MPSGITGRDGFLPALVKSIRRSFPCRHPTTGGSLKGSPAGTPLTHRFLYYPYSTTAAAVCQPSFCPGPQPAGRRDGPSGEFASAFWYREKSPFGQQKSPIYSGFSQETSFCLHIMVEQGRSRMNTPPKLRFRLQMPFLYHPAGYCQCSTASCWR